MTTQKRFYIMKKLQNNEYITKKNQQISNIINLEERRLHWLNYQKQDSSITEAHKDYVIMVLAKDFFELIPYIFDKYKKEYKKILEHISKTTLLYQDAFDLETNIQIKNHIFQDIKETINLSKKYTNDTFHIEKKIVFDAVTIANEKDSNIVASAKQFTDAKSYSLHSNKITEIHKFITLTLNTIESFYNIHCLYKKKDITNQLVFFRSFKELYCYSHLLCKEQENQYRSKSFPEKPKLHNVITNIRMIRDIAFAEKIFKEFCNPEFEDSKFFSKNSVYFIDLKDQIRSLNKLGLYFYHRILRDIEYNVTPYHKDLEKAVYYWEELIDFINNKCTVDDGKDIQNKIYEQLVTLFNKVSEYNDYSIPNIEALRLFFSVLYYDHNENNQEVSMLFKEEITESILQSLRLDRLEKLISIKIKLSSDKSTQENFEDYLMKFEAISNQELGKIDSQELKPDNSFQLEKVHIGNSISDISDIEKEECNQEKQIGMNDTFMLDINQMFIASADEILQGLKEEISQNKKTKIVHYNVALQIGFIKNK